MATAARTPVQLALDLRPRGRGGARKGAGRKRKDAEVVRIPHRPRRVFAMRCPVHVVLRVVPEVAQLRSERGFDAVYRALRSAADARHDLRVVHYSVQGNHMHLMVEARHGTSFVRGLQGLEVRIARRINRALQRQGRVFEDRYWGRALKTPREVHHALGYVLLNRAHHQRDRARSAMRPRSAAIPIDPYSTAPFFFSFLGRGTPATFGAAGPPEAPPVFEPKTWLLRTGWKRLGPIDFTTYAGRSLSQEGSS